MVVQNAGSSYEQNRWVLVVVNDPVEHRCLEVVEVDDAVVAAAVEVPVHCWIVADGAAAVAVAVGAAVVDAAAVAADDEAVVVVGAVVVAAAAEVVKYATHPDDDDY